MIVHRDYRDSSDSIIKIFDDRIEFFNPGDLYDDLTVEQLESNDYESKTRNKLIALMFKECGLIEKYGSGIGRIKRLCKEHGIIEPKFQEKQKGFKVVLYKQTIENTKSKTPLKTPLKTKDKIVELIRINKNIAIKDMAFELDLSRDTINEHLARLKKDGIIQRIGSSRSGYWEILHG